MMPTRRQCVKALAAIPGLAAAWPVFAQQSGMSGAAVQIKAGISDPVNTVLAWYMARAAGLYAAQGLNVDILDMNGGSKGAAELQAGGIDVMHVGLSSVIRVNQAGGDLRTIASLSNVIRFTFFSAPGVKTAADLKGGVVGVSTFGSESDSTVTLALQRLGLTRDDVTVKEYGGGMKRL
ncbi:MAG TPA: ABC transporter substrate-binding protein, partial [Xanthobacteraceae bacterium]|nr:ABC transporter substrate-binding protein [Xanthobacteraceae bacterium]